jgi:anti-sigma factor (TIGR02949 family)
VTDAGCHETEVRLQGYLDHALSHEEAVAVEMHLVSCDYCRERYAFEARLRDTVKQSCCSQPAPDGMVERLRSRLRLYAE